MNLRHSSFKLIQQPVLSQTGGLGPMLIIRTGYISGVRRLFEGQGRKEGHFSMCFGSQEGTLVRVLAPKRAFYHVLTSQRGSLVCFANQKGTSARFFGSQEGILVHVLALRRAL